MRSELSKYGENIMTLDATVKLQISEADVRSCFVEVKMLSMKAQVDVICCKSVGTDLSMLDIEDFITEI
ncbi:zinc finger 2-like protein [Labeo rohita]|uniref:Zinc finger 2-like protein n=1 Tax=Labeo rohita TaxID=84645 RepID=A0A498NW16_LABRO|nr:zinc finger 2-like protein [Labeo rohita]